MSITFDPKYNIAYVKLRNVVEEVKTLKVTDEINVDISSDGKIYGIELLNANVQMKLLDGNIYLDMYSLIEILKLIEKTDEVKKFWDMLESDDATDRYVENIKESLK